MTGQYHDKTYRVTVDSGVALDGTFFFLSSQAAE